MKKAIIALLFILCLFFNLNAGEPTKEPVLIINTEMHTAAVNRIDTDKNNNYILTSSRDKTAKLWDIKTGELIRTYRIPIDIEKEGQIEACAITPDAEYIVLGGTIGYFWFKKYSIYVFKTATGEMTSRIPCFGNIIKDLEFSKDGSYLAVCQTENAGVKIIDAKSWKIIKTLRGFNGTSNSCSFNTDGRMATASFDGKVRLYDKNFSLIKEASSKISKQVNVVSFSPVGSKIAVGYYDNPKIQVLDGNTLKLLYEPDVSNIPNDRKFEAFSWSNNGSFLYAGGSYGMGYEKNWSSYIRKYSNAGTGSFNDIYTGSNVLKDIKTLNVDSIIFSGQYPDWGKFDQTDKNVIDKKGEVFNFGSSPESQKTLLVNSRCDVISFQPSRSDYYTFDISEKNFEKKRSSDLLPAVIRTNNLQITDWNYTFNPKLNG